MKLRRVFKASRDRGRRVAPVELRDGVEKWARKHGRTADLVWYPAPMNCWAVVLGFRVGDPRWAAGEKGEPVFLHVWRDAAWWDKNDRKRRRKTLAGKTLPAYKAYELDELGLTGIIKILDEGDLLSGRGRFESAEKAGREQVEKFRSEKHRRRLAAREDAAHRARENRRRYLKIPFTSVGIELSPRGS